MKLSTAQGLLRITSESPESGNAIDEIPVDFNGAEVTIGFNAKYFLDVLGAVATQAAMTLHIGSLHERPRWARAYKWAPGQAETTLRRIHIRVGRTGALNPWAELEPVQVGGVLEAPLHAAGQAVGHHPCNGIRGAAGGEADEDADRCLVGLGEGADGQGQGRAWHRQQLEALFRFTPAEAKVALHLARGLSLPQIAAELDTNLKDAAWISSLFLLVGAVAGIILGRWSDMVGRRTNGTFTT